MPRMGRPKVDNPKSCYVSTLVDNATLENINRYAIEHGMTRASVIRNAIEYLLSGEKK